MFYNYTMNLASNHTTWLSIMVILSIYLLKENMTWKSSIFGWEYSFRGGKGVGDKSILCTLVQLTTIMDGP